MAANPAIFDDFDMQPRTERRSWANSVPYDVLDKGEVIGQPQTPRARINTPQLNSSVTYRPVARASYLDPEPEFWRPATTGAGVMAGKLTSADSIAAARSSARLLLYGIFAAAAVVALYIIVSSVIAWTQVRMDDLKYGNPRTTHLDAVIGNGDSAAQPTHFIALNLNRQVSIIEIPAGDTSKAVVITGPYLFGEGEDLTPVKLSVTDLNGDGKPDLLVDVKSEQMAYINDNNTFRPITADEKTKLEQAAQPAVSAKQ